MNAPCPLLFVIYARRMGQPAQRATNYTARSNIVTAQIFLHANGQRPKRASNRQRSRRRQAWGATHRARPRSFQHCQHSLYTFHTHTAASMKRDRRKSLYASRVSHAADLRCSASESSISNVVGCKIPRKENSPIFRFVLCAPPFLSPGSPELTRRLIKTSAPDKKNWVD